MDAADSSEGLLSINVWLGGRSYRIRIPRAEEAAVRCAVKKAETQIADLRQHYAGRDDQDFIAMCLIMYATAEGKGHISIATDEIEEMIRKIDKVIGEGDLL